MLLLSCFFFFGLLVLLDRIWKTETGSSGTSGTDRRAKKKGGVGVEPWDVGKSGALPVFQARDSR